MMVRKSVVAPFFALLLLCAPSLATEASPLDRFDLEALNGICASISSKQVVSENSEEYSFIYEKKIYAAAGVDFKSDNAPSAREKLRSLWNRHPRDFKCQAANFGVRDGNILKYAVATRSFNLIDDFTRTWGLDLNVVDMSDNLTVLDYIEKIELQYRGSEIGKSLNDYRLVLMKYGALHRNEVPEAQIAAQKLSYFADLRWHAARGDVQAAIELASLERGRE